MSRPLGSILQWFYDHLLLYIGLFDNYTIVFTPVIVLLFCIDPLGRLYYCFNLCFCAIVVRAMLEVLAQWDLVRACTRELGQHGAQCAWHL